MKTTLTTTFLLLFTHFCFAQSAKQEQDNFWMELDRPTGGMVLSLAVNSITEVYAGMGNGVYLSNDDSSTWILTGLEGITSYSLHIHQNGNVFAGTGGFNNLYYMENIEEGWHPLLSSTSNVISIMHTNAGDLFIGNWGEIFKSSDFGETWEQVLELDNTQVITSIVENDDGVMFAGVISYSGGGGVYHSYDNGDSWQQLGLNNKFISSLAVNSTGVLFAGSRGDYEYGGGGVFRSEDNGITWEEVAINVWVTSMAIDPNDVLYIGCTREHGGPGGVYRTTDNGDSWDHIITGMSDYYRTVEGLSLSPDGYLYAYSRWVLYRSTQPVFSSNSIIQQETIDLKIYPNPFTDILHIELPNGQPLQVPLSVKVFDPLGRVVYSNRLSNPKGFAVNLSTLPPGLYYISIELNGHRYSKPIAKVSR